MSEECDFKELSPVKLQVGQEFGLMFRPCVVENSQQSWARAGNKVSAHTIL